MIAQLLKYLVVTSFIAFIFHSEKGSSNEDGSMNENNKSAYATFAGGCFWCMEPPYDKLNGVISTVVGYTGGHKVNPTYEEVSAGETGHTEAIQIEYDPSVITFQELLDVFWQNIDPTVQNRQFCDVGSQYRSEIFYHDEKQKKTAELSKRKIEENTQIEKVYTQISPFEKFYPAEEYHQKYSIKNPIRYRFYRYTCGRDQRLRDVWGK